MCEIRQIRLEQAFFAITSVALVGEQHDMLHRRLAANDEQSAARLEPAEETVGNTINSASDNQRIEGFLRLPAVHRFTGDQLHVADACGLQALTCGDGEIGMDIHAGHAPSEVGQACGEETRTGAYICK